ncbi:MAG TPA: phosphate ABC transporter ATP-binding protein [Symbiobacteriaceae bacterium]|nr:phosphate ABC transporter ATP-binding protein [Symbiobacteriaceae bacterium]
MKLEVEKLNVYYGQVHALKDATLSIPDRNVTGLIGPSGCGKSTFLRALNRMHDLMPGARAAGSIRLDGRDIRSFRPEQLRCRIGMVFQRPNPFPMSIYDNVAFGPSLLGAPGLDDIVEESLRRAALWDEVKRRLLADARALSGGQQQRLCIARALAMNPDVLLMDEPCSALDPGSTQAVEELILSLRSDMAIMIVTHSMGQARRVADQIAFFHSGHLLEAGPDILEHPRTPELIQFLTL